MLRTTIAAFAIVLLAGAAQAAPNDATSETDAIQLDQGTQPYEPGSSMQKSPSTLPDPGEAREMNESDVINQ